LVVGGVEASQKTVHQDRPTLAFGNSTVTKKKTEIKNEVAKRTDK